MSNPEQFPTGNDAYPVNPESGLPPVPAEPSPWVSQPKYGQYAVGGGMPYAPALPPPQQFGDPKPGIVPLRALTLGDILGGAWHAVWHNPGVMIGLPLLILLGAMILSALFGLALNAPFQELNNQVLHESGLIELLREYHIDPAHLTLFSGASTASGILMALVSPLISGILAVSISQSVLGNRISAGDVWSRLRGRVGALIGWSFLMMLGLFVFAVLAALAIAGLTIAASAASTGLALFVAGLLMLAFMALGLWLSIKLLFVAPIIAIERSGIKQAIRRSWELSRGHFWRILGIYVLGTFLVSLVSGLLTTPLSLLAGGLALGGSGVAAGTSLWLSLIHTLITSLITMVFTSGILTLLYVDTRTRAEGLHNSLISATSGVSTSNW